MSGRSDAWAIDWLGTWVDEQRSLAGAQIHRYLRTAVLDKNLPLKILGVVDEMDPTIAICRGFPEQYFRAAPGRNATRRCALLPLFLLQQLRPVRDESDRLKSQLKVFADDHEFLAIRSYIVGPRRRRVSGTVLEPFQPRCCLRTP